MNEVDDATTDAQIIEAVRFAGAHPSGRMLLSVLIFMDCGFDSDQSDAKASAQREIGLRWVRRMQRHCPDDFLKLMAERLDRFRELQEQENTE